jgi:hypothetical protein
MAYGRHSLDLYAQDHDPEYPQVCFDEMPYQLIKEKRTPIPAKPGVPQRYDYEYERGGTPNLFMFFLATRQFEEWLIGFSHSWVG